MGILNTSCKSGKIGYKNELLDEEGKILTDSIDILNRWMRYYNNLLNNAIPIDEDINEFLPIKTLIIGYKFDTEITQKEIINAILKCEFNKATGPDDIPIECIKVLIQNGKNKKKKSELIELSIIPKPGDSRDCTNSRGLSLQAHLGKIFELVVGTRLFAHLQRIPYGVNITQFGCMIGRGTDDALLISSVIALSAIESNMMLYKCYIDLIKAYERVNRTLLFEILERRGVPPKLLGVIKGLYDDV